MVGPQRRSGTPRFRPRLERDRCAVCHLCRERHHLSLWFSWVISSAIVGLIIGLVWKKVRVNDGDFGIKQAILFNITQIIANVVAWFIVAPTLDIVIYMDPAKKVYLQGAIGGISNMITIGILGTLLLSTYSKTKIKTGSLRVEE